MDDELNLDVYCLMWSFTEFTKCQSGCNLPLQWSRGGRPMLCGGATAVGPCLSRLGPLLLMASGE